MNYPLIRSTLAGIFGAEVGFTETEATQALVRDLAHPPFREGLSRELSETTMEPSFSWRLMLEEYEVAYVSTEAEAVQVAKLLFGSIFPPKRDQNV